MAVTSTKTPEWVAQLEYPPLEKGKGSSIPDPAGFAGAPGNSKVRMPSTTLIIEDGRLISFRNPAKTPRYIPDNPRRPKRRTS